MNSQFKNVLVAGAAFAGILAFSAPAFAVTMKAVYEGTVYNSFDIFDLFEQNGASLNGLSYTLTYIYDAATPGALPFTSSAQNSIVGGTAIGNINPVQSATLVIGGHTEVINSNFYGVATNYNDGSTAYGNHYMQNMFNDGTTEVANWIQAIAYDSSLTVPLDLDTSYVIAAAMLGSSGDFRFRHYDIGTDLHTTFASGHLVATSLTITSLEAVPLPAALPMLVAGLGAMGFMGWRRRRKPVAVA